MSKDFLELDIDKQIYGGHCLSRLPDGRAAFVPYALPGERVRVRVAEQKRRHVRTELVEVLRPSPLRIPANCPLFTHCGGCHYQHMAYDTQLSCKMDILQEQLSWIGKIKEPPLTAPTRSPLAWNYRNHIQMHLTSKGGLGFRAQRSRAVTPISECHLPEAALNAIWPVLDFEEGTGIERVSLRSGSAEEVILILEGSNPQPPELSVALDISVVHVYEDNVVVLAGDEYLVMDVKDRPFRVSPGSFFQVNRSMVESMVDFLTDHLQVSHNMTVMDVYCGVGLFSAFLAARAGKLIGIESSPPACSDFAINLDAFDNVELYEASAEQALPHLDVKADIMLVDPPRAGLDACVVEAVITHRPAVLAYVSCDPSTLARDARLLLDGGYHLEQVALFDLFPQTYHIETISIFTC